MTARSRRRSFIATAVAAALFIPAGALAFRAMASADDLQPAGAVPIPTSPSQQQPPACLADSTHLCLAVVNNDRRRTVSVAINSSAPEYQPTSTFVGCFTVNPGETLWGSDKFLRKGDEILIAIYQSDVGECSTKNNTPYLGSWEKKVAEHGRFKVVTVG
jgi:hypothetical protein